ncbi:SCO4848 family membrane protein [Cryptosporangium sp. NPDC048952]|uniref:SCO4848 family membrane protein n=1 Tax=Cryptosporangium sp. NPDC048952 TaxID=3363961 RepID=UPI00371EC89C
MVLSRRWAAFLLVAGGWNWLIWPRFAKAIWDDPRAWSGDTPTSFLIVHAVLIVTALVIGTVIAFLGVQGLRKTRKPRREHEEAGLPS